MEKKCKYCLEDDCEWCIEKYNLNKQAEQKFIDMFRGKACAVCGYSFTEKDALEGVYISKTKNGINYKNFYHKDCEHKRYKKKETSHATDE